MNTQLQNEGIMRRLESGLSISDLEALFMFDCDQLPARINDLRKQGLHIGKVTFEDSAVRHTNYLLEE